MPNTPSVEVASDDGWSIDVEPDTQDDLHDGMYVTYEYLGQLIRRANSRTHCSSCTCT